MDDIGNFLYILIILLSVIFSAFTRKKKRAPEDERTTSIPDPMEEFKRLFGDTHDEEEVMYEERYEPQQEEVQVDRNKKYDPFVPVEEVPRPTKTVMPEETMPQTFSEKKFFAEERHDKAGSFQNDNKKSVFSNEISDEIMQGTIGDETGRVYDFTEAFDARKAIIYDAILNRPYS
ncbi:MAG: hypothetical protein ACOC31_02730 [Bacteroidota bacterium]